MVTHASAVSAARAEAEREEVGGSWSEWNEQFDPRVLFGILLRRFWAMAAVAFLVFATTVMFTHQLTPLYTASAKVMIDPEQVDVGLEGLVPGLTSRSEAIDTEVEVMQSPALAQRVALQLELVDDPEFNPALRDPDPISVFRRRIAGAISDMLDALSPVQAAPGPRFSTSGRESIALQRVTNVLRSKIRVSREGLTFVISVNVETEHPEKSARIANAYVEAYLVEQLEAKLQETRRANEWLENRLEVLRDEVKQADQVVQMFRAENGLLAADNRTLTEQEIAGLNAQLVLLRQDLDEAEARVENVRRQQRAGRPLSELPAVLASASVRDLRARQAETARQAAELSSRYGTRHPEMVKIRQEAADIENQIGREVSRIVNSLESAAEVARQRVSAAQSQLAQLRNRLARNNSSQVRLRELEREAESSRLLYESFLARFKQVNEQEDFLSADARVVSNASIPLWASFPDKMLLTAMGFIAAVAAGVGAVMLLEAFDRGVSTASELERRTGLRCIASIPRLKRKHGSPIDYVVRQPLSRFAESLRTLRNQVLRAGAGRPDGVIAVISSALPGEGKTSTAMSLARVADMSGDKVLIVDCDLRRQGLTSGLEFSGQTGFSEVIAGEVSLEDAVIKDKLTGVDILPAGQVLDMARDVFGIGAMHEFLAKCRETYKLTVLDGAPAIAVAEGRTLAALADAVVFLTEWRKTDRHTAAEGVELLRLAGANLIGGALSRVNEMQQQLYTYGYGKNYITSLKGYYTE